MKKLSIISLLCLFAIGNLQAYDFETDGIYYNILQDGYLGEIEVTHNGKPNTYSDTISLPPTRGFVYNPNKQGVFYNIVSIGDSAFYNCSDLKDVHYGSLITHIGSYAFFGCTQLTDFNFFYSEIEDHAFENCSGITSITVLETSKQLSIGDSVFVGCTGLTTITCYSKVPPAVSTNAFAGLDLAHIQLYIPYTYRSAYYNDPVWGQMDIRYVQVPYPTDYKYLSPSLVAFKFSLLIITWIVIIYMMVRFAKRNPTGYDTNYRKRLRIVLGAIVAVLYLGRFIMCVMQAPQLYTYYCSYYYGAHFSSVDVEYGVSHPLIEIVPRTLSDVAIFAIPTYEDFLLLEAVHSLGFGIALALYIFLFKRSACTKWANVRKTIGYVLLLLILPQVLDMRYFDINDFVSAAIVLLLVWLCTRTYKRDAVVSVPLAGTGQSGIKDFEPIAPEELNISSSADTPRPTGELSAEQKHVHIIKERHTKEKIQRMCHGLVKTFRKIPRPKFSLPLILGIIAILMLVTAVVLSVLYYTKYDFSEYYIEKYNLYRNKYDGYYEWKDAQEHNHIDNRLGKPIDGDMALLREFTRKNHNNEEYYDDLGSAWIIAYDITSLGYSKDSSEQYIRDIWHEYKDSYGAALEMNIISHSDEVADLVVIYKRTDFLYSYYFNGSKKSYINYIKEGKKCYSNEKNELHLICCHDGIAYERIVIFIGDLLKEGYIPSLSFSSSNTIYQRVGILSIVFYILFSIFATLWGVATLKKMRKGCRNVHAYRLCIYLFINILIDIILLPIFMKVDDHKFYDFFWLVCFPLLLDMFILKPLLFGYVYKHSFTDYRFDYLVPNWLKQSIGRYSNNQTAIRGCIIFVIYPIFYIMALPLGIYAIFYVLGALFVFYLLLFVSWIIRGVSISAKENNAPNTSNSQQNENQ